MDIETKSTPVPMAFLLNRPRLRRKDVPEYLLTVYGIDIAYSTLGKLASVGGGPAMQYSGKVPLYHQKDLNAWAEARLSQSVKSTSALGAVHYEGDMPDPLKDGSLSRDPVELDPLSPIAIQPLRSPITAALRAAGGVMALARALDIKHPSIYRWTRIPAEHVLKVEEVTGIPCYELRPDIYPASRFSSYLAKIE